MTGLAGCTALRLVRESIGFSCNAIFILPRAPMGPLRSQGYGLGQWVFSRRPQGGGCARHGTVVRSEATERGQRCQADPPLWAGSEMQQPILGLYTAPRPLRLMIWT